MNTIIRVGVLALGINFPDVGVSWEGDFTYNNMPGGGHWTIYIVKYNAKNGTIECALNGDTYKGAIRRDGGFTLMNGDFDFSNRLDGRIAGTDIAGVWVTNTQGLRTHGKFHLKKQ